MSDNTISIPTWALPLVVSVFVGAISYGAAQANAEATTEDVKRIAIIVKETASKAQANGQAVAITDTKVDAIVDSLARLDICVSSYQSNSVTTNLSNAFVNLFGSKKQQK